MPHKQAIRDAKSTRAPAPTVVWNSRGAALESGDDFTTSLKISLLEELVCPKRRVPREGTRAEGQGDPGSAARRGPAAAPLRQKFAPSPRQMTGTASHPRRRRDHPPTPHPHTPPPRPAPGSSSRLCIFRTALVAPSRQRFKAGTALAQLRPYRGGERRRGTPSSSLRKEEGDDPSRQSHRGGSGRCQGKRASSSLPPPWDLRPAAREVQRCAAAPHAGQPPTLLLIPAGQGQRPHPRVAEKQQRQQTPTRRASQSSQS